MTKRAICYDACLILECVPEDEPMGGLTILEPTATPRLRLSLSLTDTVTAVTCSEKKKRQ